MKSGISLLFLCIHLMMCSSTKLKLQMLTVERNHVRVAKDEYSQLLSLTDTSVHLSNFQDNKNEPNNENGFKKQTLTVVLDTGSNVLWVSSALGDDTVKFGKVNTYDHNSSATYEPVKGFEKDYFIMNYGQGTIKGYFASDQVTIGDITIKNQEFGEVFHREGFSEESDRFDGILGLSLPSPKPDFVNFSVIPSMIREKLIEKQVITFSFNRNTSGKIDGEAAFGEIDNTKFKGEIWYFKIIPNDVFWMIAFEGIILDNINVLTPNTLAIADTGTSLILGPMEDVLQIIDIIKKHNVEINSDNTFNCTDTEKLPMITFSFQGKEFYLKGENYTHKVKGSKKHECYIGFGITVTSKTWILGLVFLENVYSVFDYENRQVGFAELA